MPSPVTHVQLFATCLVDQFFPHVGLATATVLERLGVRVEVPLDLTCCGQPAFNGGFRAEARAMARHTLSVLASSQAPVVVPSGSCAHMIVHHYPELLRDEPAFSEKAREIAGRTYELSQFLVDVLGVTRVGACVRRRVAYHASCHTLRGLGMTEEPQRLLAGIEGLTPCALADETTCCGFGGVFSVKLPEVSGALLERRIETLEASGAEVVTATDVSCLMHLGGALRRRSHRIEIRHLAELLATQDGA